MRRLLSGLAVLVLLLSVALTVFRYLPLAMSVPAMIAAFSAYAVVTYVVAGLLLLALTPGARRRQLVLGAALVSLVAAGFHAYLLAPLYYGDARGEQGDVTVLAANLEVGEGDVNTVVREAAARRVDVLVLEEVTPDAEARLKAAGAMELLPYTAGAARSGVSGTLVLSRWKLTDAVDLPVSNGAVDVRVGAPKPFRLLALHTTPPLYGVTQWRRDLAIVQERAALDLKAGATVVAGDFNATDDHPFFRDVLGAGLSDSPAQANVGWRPTWPTHYRRSWYLPALALDHVLTGPQFSARTVRTVSVPDTDHLALLVSLDRL